MFGLTDDGVLFVFDLDAKTVLRRKDLSAHGGAVRTDQSLRMWSGSLLVLLQNAILMLDPETLEAAHVIETPTPVRAGIALVDGRLYYASGAHLMSLDLTACFPR